MSKETHTPPSDLRTPGRSLWTAITTEYDLADHERAVLLEAGRTVDLLADLQAEVLAGGAMVDGPNGLRVNPAAVEARAQRLVLARLIVCLRIPVDSSEGRTQARPMRGVHRLRGV